MAPAAYKDLCLDAVDPLRLGTFWAAVLGLELADAGEGDAVLRGPSPEHTVWINAVPEPKTVKHRMHLDVHARSVDELLALGATVVDEQPRWTVMADPEGGEFCAFVRAEPPPYRLYEVGLDAADARSVGRWWAELLDVAGRRSPSTERRLIAKPVSLAATGGGTSTRARSSCTSPTSPARPSSRWTSPRCPSRSPAKNRVHLDVVGDVAEIVARGATVLDEQPRWTVMADVEGNEFCVFPPA